MTLRFRALIVAAAAALVAPGGGAPARAADVAATVDGVDITVDDLEQELADNGAATDNAVVDGATVRRALGNLIQEEILRGAGVDLDGADNPVQALVDAGLYDDAPARAEYEDGGGVSGDTICAFVIAFESADDAAEARDEIDDTASFRAYAQDNGLQSAGLSMDGSGACGSISSLIPDVVEPISSALADAGVDTPTEPVEIQDGHFLLIAPPFDDVATAVDSDAINEVVTSLLADAEVSVHPRFGRWDAARGAVVELDASTEPARPTPAVAG